MTATDGGTRILLSGTIAADAKPLLRTSPITDPNTFGRTALIEALARAGVRVTADASGPNPAARLPRSYDGRPRVAAYTSPPYDQYAKLILKVSHNLGANLGICLMAVTTGSHQCADGFPVLAGFLDRAGVDRKQAELMDGRGGNPADRATPRALVQMLAYWQRTPDAQRFREALPILGVDGLLAENCRSCPARGKVFGKTGAAVGGDSSTTGWPSARSPSPATSTRAAAASTPSTRASTVPPPRPPTPSTSCPSPTTWP